ncbi:NADP-dependent phosphogluconate dehydrogenase [Ramlibacter ginsenosidimutans]|uniref:6-phosphogluconate dehydrogenase, decarboxylating n=1 Tax=Ramlibacter ginsenosidimutans TaxID=502333 RepID=A0A934WKN0_9BURK|nr:NADP-dependent phosphogluconate dehydrogenase [Ramlibacter ginsenosidimutans]MBK6004533.1 NADP-dependent phosphogluconate dehydrogenase [Ramlibacter ginsenosidimutans]
MAEQQAGDIGVVGLGVMGHSLALNLVRHGYTVVGLDLDEGKRAQLLRVAEGRARAVASVLDMLQALQSPRRILLMVPAGAAVDAVLAELRPHLARGDVVIDGGNTRYTDTQRRMAALSGTGILYVGAGISGGEQGALLGPSIMPGGDAQAWPLLRPMLQAIAAKTADGQPCCEWMGSGASGHFVKMVHNGIEYAEMQLIGEVYALLRGLAGLHAREAGQVFAKWNRGELESYLTQITADILHHEDAESGQPLVDLILDTAEQKGTGKWATQAALDLGVPASTMGEAVFARAVSAAKPLREQAAKLLPGPRPDGGQGPEWIPRLRDALLAARLCAYAQGFQLLAAGNAEYQWGMDLVRIASVWRAGCIIRARVLDDLRAALAASPPPAHLLLAPGLGDMLARTQQPLREVVAAAVLQGTPVPGLASALASYDGLRTARLPANLLAAQRDYFGAHRYQRVDRAGSFHTDWIAL